MSEGQSRTIKLPERTRNGEEQRVVVVDHGDIGIAVVYQEKHVRGPQSRASWTRQQEECLIPRDAWPKVLSVVAEFLKPHHLPGCQAHDTDDDDWWVCDPDCKVPPRPNSNDRCERG